MTTIGERIRQRRLELEMSQEFLAKQIGYKDRSSINKIEADERNLTQSKIKMIADALQTTPAYIMGWEEETSENNLFPHDLPHLSRIPILGQIRAGLPLYADEHIEGYTYTDLNSGAEYFGLRVTGDSMDTARINPGDILIVRRQNTVENGDIAVVLVDDEAATVKRFYQDGHTVTLVPQSNNPDHRPQLYDIRKTPIRILGKVVRNQIDF